MRISRTRSIKVNLAIHLVDGVMCKLWVGHCNSVSGHGQRWDPVQRRVRGAHVMAWEEANGETVPEGKLIRHRCNNPPCVEPTHLALGDHKDNHADSVLAGTAVTPPVRFGEQHGRHKLTDAQVADLRESYTGARGEKAALAGRFGISATQVSNILGRRQRP